MSVGESNVVADGWGWRFGAIPSLSNDGVSFTISAGERVLLLGSSGSGKSTLLRGIAGLLSEDEGEAVGSLTVNGHDARALAGRVGFVLQDPDSQAVMATVGDDVAFGCENFGVPADQIWSRVAQSLEHVGLDVPLEHPTSHLSGGQKQRLALAGALATSPDVLLLDEPTANLDPAGAAMVRASVEAVADRTQSTVIVVEHRVDLWWDFATRVIVLGAGGNVIADGSPESVLAQAHDELERAGIWLPDFEPPIYPTGEPGSTLIQAQGLAVARRHAPDAQSGLSFDISAGELIAVTGDNGCGKTTLALTLGGLIPASAGRLEATDFLASGLGSDPIRWTSKQLHTRIGSVFQTPGHQFVRPSVREELRLSAATAGLSGADQAAAVDDILLRMRLEEQAKKNPFALSGGQQRRLSVATALIAKPQMLILDEPTFGQDANTWRELVSMMSGLCEQGRAVVVVTHDTHLRSVASREIRLAIS